MNIDMKYVYFQTDVYYVCNFHMSYKIHNETQYHMQIQSRTKTYFFVNPNIQPTIQLFHELYVNTIVQEIQLWYKMCTL